jgi:hypothetical protein
MTAALAGGLVFLAACGGDKEVGADRLEPIEAGVAKDSLFKVMGKGPLTAMYADTLRVVNGFRYDKYLINGQYYEVLYFREQPGNVSEPVEQFVETPIVLKDDKVLGWGWKFYVEEGMENLKLPTPLKEKVEPAKPVPAPQPASTDSTTKS